MCDELLLGRHFNQDGLGVAAQEPMFQVSGLAQGVNWVPVVTHAGYSINFVPVGLVCVSGVVPVVSRSQSYGTQAAGLRTCSLSFLQTCTTVAVIGNKSICAVVSYKSSFAVVSFEF